MKQLIALLIISCIYGKTIAQVDRTPTPSNKNENNKNDGIIAVLKNLNLSKEQAAQLKLLRENMLDSIDAINNNATLTAQQKRRNILQARLAQKKAIDTILTPDQLLIFNKSIQQQLKASNKSTPGINE
ncbi:hypothetical protein ACFOWM_05805 [Ferruginibacter yonginensis]|uniref:LTXXQ motif family protein n=1 Tax=Ferruginibacter yonginensis TaxID=1310416 RepID=A0ABV8QQB4_9BACT